MTGYVGTSGGRKTITGLWVGTASGRKTVQTAWIGTATGNKVWYQSGSATLTAAALSSTAIRLTATPTGTVTSYKFYRGSTFLGEQAGAVKDDTGLTPATAYSYSVEAYNGTTLLNTATASTSTQAVAYTQKTWEGLRSSYASYSGSGARRTDTADLYSGYYSSNWGNQKSSANFDIPDEIRNCYAIDAVYVRAWNVHAYNNSGRNVQLAVNHYRNATDGSGSTGTAVELHAGKPGWVGDTEWVEVKNYVCPGRTSIGEEFRVNGGWGITFNSGPTTSQAYYGYISNDVRLKIVYRVRSN